MNTLSSANENTLLDTNERSNSYTLSSANENTLLDTNDRSNSNTLLDTNESLCSNTLSSANENTLLNTNERSNSNTCYFCYESHSCRNCPIEAMVAPYMKKIIGIHMENFVADTLFCPKCNNNGLILLGNHTPSLDIICNNCCTNFEVKSKCLSIDKLPTDLMLHHGNYFDYISRQESGLDFLIIIYKVNRKMKMIEIRKILYIPNEIIKEQSHFKVVQKYNSSMSTIYIKDYTKLPEIKLNCRYNYNFTNDIIELYENQYLIYEPNPHIRSHL